MNLVLERVSPNSVFGKYTLENLFDSKGTLLLKKGLQINDNIRERLKRREIYVLQDHKDSTTKSIKRFPRDAYVKLVGFLWTIYHEEKLIGPEQIEKTVDLVNLILKEIQSQDVYLDFNAGLVDLEKFKQHDYRTFIHAVNVALLSALTGMRLGYQGEALKELTLGALLHDLGKLHIPCEILNKPGSLSEVEFKIIKQHPLMGGEMLKNTHLLPNVMATIKEHHERWNGKGYPYGLRGNDIHTDAQIVAVADVYEALTADRPYRKGLPPYHALEMIIAWSGKDFNPKLVQAFRESLILYPENAKITLNTGEIGVVVAIPVQMPTRPLLRLLFDREGSYVNCETYIDLMQDLTSFIERVEFEELG